MANKKDKPRRSILKTEGDDSLMPHLGGYNLYAKRASFKEDVLFQQFSEATSDSNPQPEVVPAVALPLRGQTAVTPGKITTTVPIQPDEMEAKLPAHEVERRHLFKEKRRLMVLEDADGVNVKDALAHPVELSTSMEDEAGQSILDASSTLTSSSSSAIPLDKTPRRHDSSGPAHQLDSAHLGSNKQAQNDDDDDELHGARRDAR